TNEPQGAAPQAGRDVWALGVRRDAAVVLAAGRVAWIGDAGHGPAADERVDCAGAAVLPGFVDSHAHLVFAGDRAEEFAARMAGKSCAAGGISSTVAATRAASDDLLRSNLARLVSELVRSGSTTFEVKSGYGLTVVDEARACRLAAEFTEEVTFLGGHVVPPEYADDRAGYVALVTGPMLAACAPVARWADVFCDRGAFDADESRAMLLTAGVAGLGLRVHANQLQPGPGVALAVELGAASADHCTHLTQADVDALAGGTTVATLLPGAEFSMRSPYPEARRLLDARVTVALATDCNPGTSYTTSMPFCLALAVREMRMTPAEAVRSATAGGAAALRRHDVGRVAVGGPADLVVLSAPSYVHLAYRPGVGLVAQVWRGGRLVHARGQVDIHGRAGTRSQGPSRGAGRAHQGRRAPGEDRARG
ncbi:MAG: imidazolonepropionase, partial [Candidatus Nanopelagicales bacterium]